MNKKILKKVKNKFINRFETPPMMVFSPGRINLIGEHTDYNDGFAFPAAINKGIFLAIQKSNTAKSTLVALNKKELYEFDINDIYPLENGGWKNYILGVIAELKLIGKKVENFNAVFAGNIPGGAGMSSSAALENSFVFGLNKLYDFGLSRTEMIVISQKAEHHYVGVQCGIMDQYASMFGVKKSALLLDCRTVNSHHFKIDFKNYKLMLINTNVKHDLSESAYNDRRAVCEKVSRSLGVIALRDVSLKQLQDNKGLFSAEEYLKAQYVIEENKRVHKFSEAIQKNEMKTLGNLLFESHYGLSQQYKVSCKELDFLVEQATQINGIIGARMMGGGFGGCTINLVKKDDYKNIKKEMTRRFQDVFKRDCSIFSVKLSQGTRIIN